MSDTRPMRIVLDTNIIYGRWFLRGPSFDLLERFLKATGASLLVPHIVVQECIKKYREELAATHGRVRTSVEELRRLLPKLPGPGVPELSIDDAARDYEQALHARLRELNAQCPTYKAIRLSDVVNRALGGRRPFRKGDRGLRDTILWETIICDVASTEEQTVLITSDADFRDGESLHLDLKRDFVKAGLADDAVIVVKALERFNDEYVKPTLQHVLSALAALKDGNLGEFSPKGFFDERREELAEAAGEHVCDLVDEANTFELRALEGDLSLADFVETKGIDVEEAYELDPERIFVRMTADGVATVDGFLFKSNYYCLPDENSLMVMDDDWNEHFMWVHVEMYAAMTVNVTLNAKSGEVDSWEVEYLTSRESDTL